MTADPEAPYGVIAFVADAKRIMESPHGVDDRAAAVRALEPLLRRALDGPGWEDPRYATVTANGRPGFSYYRNPDTSQLNLMERVWGHLKDKLSCHRWWADLAALESATGCLLSHLRARFHQPDPGGIALVQTFSEAA
jgi:hypothetical protein